MNNYIKVVLAALVMYNNTSVQSTEYKISNDEAKQIIFNELEKIKTNREMHNIDFWILYDRMVKSYYEREDFLKQKTTLEHQTSISRKQAILILSYLTNIIGRILTQYSIFSNTDCLISLMNKLDHISTKLLSSLSNIMSSDNIHDTKTFEQHYAEIVNSSITETINILNEMHNIANEISDDFADDIESIVTVLPVLYNVDIYKTISNMHIV